MNVKSRSEARQARVLRDLPPATRFLDGATESAGIYSL
jgi:hypothetical protein